MAKATPLHNAAVWHKAAQKVVPASEAEEARLRYEQARRARILAERKEELLSFLFSPEWQDAQVVMHYATPEQGGGSILLASKATKASPIGLFLGETLRIAGCRDIHTGLFLQKTDEGRLEWSRAIESAANGTNALDTELTALIVNPCSPSIERLFQELDNNTWMRTSEGRLSPETLFLLIQEAITNVAQRVIL